ncbi:quinol:cytochrome c oxidoreductase monoheme cytochrome subunit [Bizionia echini]|uniref:Quinol:cytochrome c oxidoreductase monoheme cytochrome subunit n=1 Tax=Bizionia echini TaxID=649333 RepID=A0A1I4ZST7_9FLAO|nr:cytochrome c [Bizionia echini]SFN53049.1 quinol:cytochrome c oxidoreductase monoheme cytochrome subunit [Bizionia echini]
MKALIKITIIALVLVSVVSCNKDSSRNYQYMPNMYESVGYETYSETEAFRNGVEAQLPAEGSVARGHIPFDIDDTLEGYNLAKTTLTNKLDSTQIDSARGKELYDIYCGICHGPKGDGQGNLVKREKILGIPSYADVGRAITAGSIYHTIYYGKNAMGSYANQLNEEERWQVTAYVLELKANLEK